MAFSCHVKYVTNPELLATVMQVNGCIKQNVVMASVSMGVTFVNAFGLLEFGLHLGQGFHVYEEWI